MLFATPVLYGAHLMVLTSISSFTIKSHRLLLDLLERIFQHTPSINYKAKPIKV